MNSKPRRKYDHNFKRNAVLLCSEPGKSVTQVAANLTINKELLYRWRREYHRANGRVPWKLGVNQALRNYSGPTPSESIPSKLFTALATA